MNIRILITSVVAFSIPPLAFGQMYGGQNMQPRTQPPQQTSSGSEKMTTTTTTKHVLPVGVKGYLDDVMSHSKDQKFHMNVNGKDLPLTLVKIHQEQKLSGGKGSTSVEMKGVDGKAYVIDFFSADDQVTSARIRTINGKAP
jgi:uncharacterized protein YfaP (DUF2135 family)